MSKKHLTPEQQAAIDREEAERKARESPPTSSPTSPQGASRTEPAKSKTPGLDEMWDRLQKEKAELLKVVRPARETYEKLVNDPKLVEARKVIADNQQRLGELDNEIAAIARARGARRLLAEPGQFSAEKK